MKVEFTKFSRITLTFLCLQALVGCSQPPLYVEEHQPVSDRSLERLAAPGSYQEHSQLPIAIVSNEASKVVFELTNQTGEPLGYASYAPDWILVSTQYRLDNDWNWDAGQLDHCGTGLESFSLPPGSQAKIYVYRLSDAWCRAAFTVRGLTSGKVYRVASHGIAPWAPYWRR